MPDWSYQTLIRPALRSSAHLRGAAPRLLDRFGRSRWASPLVGLLGHMQPPASEARGFLGQQLGSRVGIGCNIPDHDLLSPLTSRFGVGFVELRCDAARRMRLEKPRSHSAPVAVRIDLSPNASQADVDDAVAAVKALAPVAAWFTLGDPAPGPSSALDPMEGWWQAARDLADTARAQGKAVLAATTFAGDDVEEVAHRARLCGLAGLVLAPGADGRPGLASLARARAAWPESALICRGVREPGDALRAYEHGADLVAVEEGLLESGPGLPKRILEARRARDPAEPRSWRALAPWVAMTLFGLGLLFVGSLAVMVGATRVTLPYDEEFLGMSRAGLQAVPRLLPFMMHDRVTYGVTAASLGLLYASLAYYALARGEHWAKRTLLWSGLVGFSATLADLVIQYFDPLHLVVWVLEFVLFFLGLRGRADGPPTAVVPDLRNDGPWRRAQWGQLLFVTLGVGLLVAGASIAAIGLSTTFIPSDERYLGAGQATFDAINPRLVAVIAHDREGFGIALASEGVAVLLATLWGFRRGAAWLWWALASAGAIGFVGTILVHILVGYMDGWHLLPAYLGSVMFVAACALSRGFLCARPNPPTNPSSLPAARSRN